MEKINYYHAKIVNPNKPSLWDSVFEHKQLNVIGENTDYIVVDDDYFTTIKKKGESCTRSVLDRASINVTIGDSCFGDYVWFSLYTAKKKRLSTIRKSLERYIEERYGWLLSDFNLDIIK